MDDMEQVVKIVRNSARQGPHRFHLLGMSELGLQLLFFLLGQKFIRDIKELDNDTNFTSRIFNCGRIDDTMSFLSVFLHHIELVMVSFLLSV